MRNELESKPKGKKRPSLCGWVTTHVAVRHGCHLASSTLFLLLLLLLLQLRNSPNIHQQLVGRDRTLAGAERTRKPHFAWHLSLLDPRASPADDVDAPCHELHVCFMKGMVV
jgi:hypothetical protein